MLQNYYFRFILFVFLSIAAQPAKACQGAALVNYSAVVGPNGVSINANSSPSVCGCGPYWMETEIICFSSGNFSGNPPVWNSPVWNIYPWYHSTLNNFVPPFGNDQCVLEPYWVTFIPFTDLCPGATYILRSREMAGGVGGGPGPWTAVTQFITPGNPVNPSFSLLSSSVSDTICLGQSLSVSASVSSANTCGSTGSPLFSWSASPAQPGLPATGSSVTFTPTVSCVVTVSVAGGPFTCYAPPPQTFSVTVIQPPVAGTASASVSSVCADSCFTLSIASYANGNLQWQASPDLITWTNLPGLTTSTVQYCNLSTGLYFRALIDGVCTDMASNAFYVASQPVVPLSVNASPLSICVGESTTLTASGATTYTWNGGALLNAPGATQVVQPLTTTQYFVTGNPQAACPSTDTVTVVVNQLPQLLFEPQNPLRCLGDTLLLQCGADSNFYNWNNAGSLIALNPAVNDSMLCIAAQSLTYVVTAVSPAGCTTSDSVFVRVAAVPVVSASEDTLRLCLNAPDTVVFSGASVYAVSPLAGVSALDSSGSTMAFSVSLPQVYFVTGTDSNGCASTISLYADTLRSVEVSATIGYTICSGNQLLLSASGAPSFSWTGSNIVSGATTSSVVVAPDTTSFYIVTGSNADGCTATDTAFVFVNQLPVVSFSLSGSDTFCASDVPVLLTGYQPAGGSFSGTAVFGNTFYPTISGSGIFPIIYTYTAANGCAATASDTLYIDVCAGTDEETPPVAANVYPNPVNEVLMIDVKEPGIVFAEIIDAQGRMMLRRELATGNTQVNCSNWPSGTYLVSLVCENRRVVYQVVKH